MGNSEELTKEERLKRGIKVAVASDKLSATVELRSAELADLALDSSDVMRALTAAKVNFGIKQEVIDEMVLAKQYDDKRIVAEGKAPVHGVDATIEYCFEKDRKIAPKEGEDGRIDYRDMDFLQNAEPGQVLVKKTPATKGTPGKSVLGSELAAKPGKDSKISKGSNTELSADGLTLSATEAGTIVSTGSVVSVQPVTTISGSVDQSTGNITCKGTLKVTEDIKSDFKVDVEGDLEVEGNVEDAEINCKGEVIIRGGFIGRGDGVINSEGNVTIKYILNQTIHANGDVTIGGEAVNAHVHAKNEINVLGQKGKIVGGTSTARKLIKAPVLGADAGTKTILKVAYDAKLMKEIKDIDGEMERLQADGNRVKEALVDLYKLKLSNKLPKNKVEVFNKLDAFKRNLPQQLEALKQRKIELKEKFKSLIKAKIVAELQAFPGVQAHIGIKYKELQSERGPTLFEFYDDNIMAGPYDKATFEAQQRKEAVEEAKKEQEKNQAEATEKSSSPA